MIEINSSKIDKNLLEEEIESIIDRYNKNPQKIKKIKKIKKIEKKIYEIEDFTKYHDIKFIENLYKKILLREVDQNALETRLELLRSGKRSKSEILSMVRFSKEGRDKNMPILGIKKRLFITILNRIPILSFFMKLFMLPKFMERVNRFEAHFFLYQQEQNNKVVHIEQSVSNIEESVSDIEKNLNHNKNTIKEIEYRIYEIQRAKESLKEMEKNLSNIIDNIKKNVSNKNIIQDLEKEQNSDLDELYISFEDKFRGTRENIKLKQLYYLPIVKNIIKEPNSLLLDIGSGRGEWLELLKENGIKARGIDLNRLMVKESNDLGLDVIYEDALSYLKSLEADTVSIVTGFHIVEHLPFKTLISIFDEVYRVLKIGGVVIFETPNPENLMVGSCNFYTDPTHINPIPPVTLQFLAQNRGFNKVTIHRLNPVKKPEFIDAKNSKDINDLIYASTKEQDYSIIGYK